MEHTDTNPSLSNLSVFADATFKAVGPSRIAALTLYVVVRDGDLNVAQVTRATQRIQTAQAMLKTGFADGLATLGHRPSDTLQKARVQALRTLGRLERMGALSMDGLAQIQDTAHMRALCLTQVDEHVSAFLAMMLQELQQEQDSRTKRQKAHAMRSVHQAEHMGKSIHLVAINASIEAARAGDTGIGFKVIADEIQKLATQTQGLLGHVGEALRKI